MADDPGRGVVVAGSPRAAEAGARVLRDGGNAADAAIATALALCVTDPANATIAGRAQILWRDDRGRTGAIDGATRVPTGGAGGPPVPLPGLPAALFRLHRERGRTAFASLVEPALELAEEGFAVTPQLAVAWRARRDHLAADRTAARIFLDSEGRPPEAGTLFRQPALARLLETLARKPPEVFLDTLLRSHPLGAGRAAEIEPEAPAGEILHGRHFGGELHTVGRQGWGHALLFLLALLEAFDGSLAFDDPEDLRRLARCVLWAVHDRRLAAPREDPTCGAGRLKRLLSPAHLARRREDVARGRIPPRPPPAGGEEARDTTHLSVIGPEGDAVAVTLSAGPHFGSAVADPEFGFLHAVSYRMAAGGSRPGPDWTEMSPTIGETAEGGLLVAGAAGSERIPVATALVLWHRLARGLSIARAVAAPRMVVHGGTLRIWRGAPPWVGERLRAGDWPVEPAGPGVVDHCGIVQIAERTPAGEMTGAADPAYDGVAFVVARS